jgi:aminoglycoside phosphotransferase (APT) family kinase protein
MENERESRGVQADEARLRLTVERLLTRTSGQPAKLCSLSREPSPFATLFPAEVLSGELEGGGEVSLFVKHLGMEQADHPEKQRRDREVLVYDRLLRHEGLPVARYYGSVWDEQVKRQLVFLEHVADWNLKYQDMEHWFTAAGRLAQLHRHFAARSTMILDCDFLLRFDAAYFSDWARRALAAVAEGVPELTQQLRHVVSHYEGAIAVLSQQPMTLIHNDLSPKNVLADRSRSPARICFVDWEMAGVGCGLLDLVHLKYGLDPDNDRRMVQAYGEELAGTGLLPSQPRELGRLLAACELHKTLYRLAFSQTWGLPPPQVAEWVHEAQALFDRLASAEKMTR